MATSEWPFNMKTTCTSLSWLTCWFCALIIGLPLAAAEHRPNIVLITADDLGFDDLSLHQHPLLSTPNLDELAQTGVQFSDFSVSPVCATTRASLLTGRDFYRTGVSGVHGGRDFLNLSETLISDVLKKEGYATGMWGKWHLGKTDGYLPHQRGFDEAYYAELYRHKNSLGFLNGKPVEHNKWVSDVITDYAITFMDAQKSPFFVHLSYLAPHEPWLAPDSFTSKFSELGERPPIANLYGMIEEMDHHIGRLLTFLDQTQLSDNTLVIFLSDNGPWWDSSNLGAMTQAEWKTRNPSKMNGNKGQSWQNGVRSPLFIRWKGKWESTTVDRYVEVKDIFPTILEITGIEESNNDLALDGVSFLPYLNGQLDGENPRHTYIASHDVYSGKPLFNQWTPVDDAVRQAMRYESQTIGLRTEKFKLLLNPGMDRKSYPKPVDRYVLFNMQEDPLERNNVIDAHPLVAAKLKAKLQAKFEELRQDKSAFSPPVYLIDHRRNFSIINGFGPSRTTGNTLSRPHHLTQMKAFGDSASYLVNVSQSGDYDIYIQVNGTDGNSMRIRIELGKNSIQSVLSGQDFQHIGQLRFPEGQQTLNFSVIENTSMKPWAAINGFRRLILAPKGTNLDFDHLNIPY